MCKMCVSAYELTEEELAAIAGNFRSTGLIEDVGSRECRLPATPTSGSDDTVGGVESCGEPPTKQLKVEPSPDSHPVSSAHPRESCRACLGILSDSFVRDLTDSIVKEYERARYIGVRTFCLSLSTPLSLLIRKTAMDLWLQRQRQLPPLDTPPSPHCGYVKEKLRHQLKLALGGRLSPPLTHDTLGPFQIIVKMEHESSQDECETITRLKSSSDGPSPQSKRRWRRKHRKDGLQPEMNVSTLTAILEGATAEEFESLHMLVPHAPTSRCSYEISFLHKPMFLAGRYNKYSRSLPQTPWVVEGVRKSETSVQELIQAKVMELVCPSELRFSSSGREDVDVRMLGNGRPFLLELVNPRRVSISDEELASVQAAINGATELVAVHHLQVVGRDAANTLKDGEESKTKLYSAVVWTPQETTPTSLSFLAEIKNLKIHQKTPIRVLHRRSLATRERTIHSLRGEWLDAHHFALRLSTQAGTYIKEFVHGDFGRTWPSLRDLMSQEVDILTLDVEEVALEWPPGTATVPGNTLTTQGDTPTGPG